MRVVEGWHPSRPDRLGYNLLVDGDWVGTFETLEGAASAAAPHVGSQGEAIEGRPIALLPYLGSGHGAVDRSARD